MRNVNFHICAQAGACQKKNDEELVKMARKNKQCYVCLVKRYEDKISRYIYRISGVRQETVQDIVQNVFLKVYINLNEFDDELKFSSWLYRIAHNETINYWRRNKKMKSSKISWDENEGLKNVIKDDYNVEDEVYQKLTNEKLIKTIENLDAKYKTVIVLNYLEGKSYQEIADILKKPIGTVGTLISRAKKILAQKLLDQGVGPEMAIRK